MWLEQRKQRGEEGGLEKNVAGTGVVGKIFWRPGSNCEDFDSWLTELSSL